MQWRFGPFRLDVDNACLWRGDERLELRPKTFEVLTYLVEHAGDLVTSDDLLDAVWPDTAVADNVLKVSMSELRKMLGENARNPQFIATVHRRGYRLIAPVEPLGPSSEAPPTPVAVDLPLDQDHEIPTPLSTMLVDRDRDLARLHQHLETARAEQRQVLFVSGEAGIGKTALIDTFVHQAVQTHKIDVSRGQCIDQYGVGEAYMPLLEALGLLLRGGRREELLAKLKQQAPSWLLQLPAFVPEAEFDLLQRRASGSTRERMLRELAELMEMLTAERPLVLILEDLHWSDVSTLDWVTYMARRRQPARLLIVGTYRPVDAALREHPVRNVSQDLMVHGHAAELVLDYLSEAGVTAYLRQRLESTSVPLAFAQELYQRTNGNPLFVRTMIDELELQGVLQMGAHGEVQWEALRAQKLQAPSGIQHLIAQQFEQLPPGEQEVLEAASVTGKEFATAVLADCVARNTEEIESQCTMWARRGQFVRSCGVERWPDGTVSERFAFTHDLYRETLYERLAAGRRQRLHLQIGLRLESGYGEEARHNATALAEHFGRGFDMWRAVTYLQHAAENASRRAAFTEVLQHTATALELLEPAPESQDRMQCELRLQMMRGQALMMTQGYAVAAVEHAYRRAQDLCAHVEDPVQHFQALQGLANFYVVQAEHHTAQGLGAQLLALARQQQQDSMLHVSHFVLGMPSYFLGALEDAHTHWTQSLALYNPRHQFLGTDIGIFCRSLLTHALCHLGYGEQALTSSTEALAQARQLSSPFSLALALAYATILHQFRRDMPRVQELSMATVALCEAQGFPYYGSWGIIVQGWAQTVQGQSQEGIAQMRQGLDAVQTTGGEVRLPYYLSLLAEAYGNAGQATEGLSLLDRALAQTQNKGERWYEAELHRLKGELLLQTGKAGAQGEVEAHFHQALDVARQQQAKSWELRAAMSLSRLWQQQDKRREAVELLSPVYNWFTEGFDLADLQDAKALLNALR